MNADFKINGLVLESERLILRPFCPEDLDDLYAYASVEGVGEMAGWRHHESKEKSKEVLDMFISENKVFALVLKENGKVIGSLGVEKYGLEDKLTEFDGYLGREIGYVLSKDYWGMGLMPEAVRTVINYLFDVTDLDFLTCGYYDFNSQSRRVQEKCGFKPYRRLKMETGMGTTEDGILNLLINPGKDIKFIFSHPETMIYQEKCKMKREIDELLGKFSTEIKELYIKLRDVIYSVAEPDEELWARLPSYYVGEKFVRLIPFKDHINIEAAAIPCHKDGLAGYKITPKGMLQIFIGQEVPCEELKKIIKETLG